MFRRAQRRSESSDEYPSGSPIYVSALFGYVIGALCLVSLSLSMTCRAWLVYCCQCHVMPG